MADFDAFAAEPEQAAEEDPAAEFLAREQSELAGLEDFESNDAAQSQGTDLSGRESYRFDTRHSNFHILW